MHTIEFASSAAREFRALHATLKRRIAQAIDRLAQDPRPKDVRKLKGREQLYRLRVGAYRVIYEIDDRARLVRITHIRHRQEAYR